MANNNIKNTPDEMDYLNYKLQLAQEEYDEFIDLICNALKIENLPENIDNIWVIKSLLSHGAIGIYNLNKNELWLPASKGSEVDEMGKPKNWLLSTANGHTFNVKSESIKIIRLRPSTRGLTSWLWNESLNLASIKMFKLDNMIANQNAVIYECADDKTAIEMKSVFKKRQIGMPAIFSRKQGIADATKALGANVPFVADKLNQLYVEDKNRVKERLGILTANSEKKERVQVGEITASVGEVVDSIYCFIDTFNTDAEKAGIPQRMKLNGTVEDLYADYNEQGDEENGNSNDSDNN